MGQDYSDFWFIVYVNMSWFIISYHLNFYNIDRYQKNIDVISRLLMQFIIFTFVYIAYFSLREEVIDIRYQFKLLGIIFLGISVFRSLYLFALQRYRAEGGNFRNIVFIGSNPSADYIARFIEEHPETGYKTLGYFSNKDTDKDQYLGKIEDSFHFFENNTVDEIYCSIADLSRSQVEKFISYADNHLMKIKLLPDAKNIYTTKMQVDYFDYIPVLSLRRIPFDDPANQLLKRTFDIVFSSIVIVFVLSWLSPLLYFLIRMESKGPLFFKQRRDGLDGDTFVCYKYRSMFMNDEADKIQAIRGDNRVTRIGKFLRRTSIDELPQFFNVFVGDMSVVGPRPHMLSQTRKYMKIVDKFMVRHMVKPGITGLAQIKGYRGEIEKKSDMENRVKLDIFYIENWSFFLDLKIIIQTVINALKGEEKAY